LAAAARRPEPVCRAGGRRHGAEAGGAPADTVKPDLRRAVNSVIDMGLSRRISWLHQISAWPGCIARMRAHGAGHVDFGACAMTTSLDAKQPPPPGSIEFELTDLENARLALEELPEGVDKVPTLAADYWEQRRRKPLPTDRALQGATIDWLLRLPGALQPRRLCDRYPRAANAVAAAWGGPERAAVLEELLSDRRGKRRGFPPEIRSELEALRYAVAHPEACGLGVA
jgi:hypothetical protein